MCAKEFRIAVAHRSRCAIDASPIEFAAFGVTNTTEEKNDVKRKEIEESLLMLLFLSLPDFAKLRVLMCTHKSRHFGVAVQLSLDNISTRK